MKRPLIALLALTALLSTSGCKTVAVGFVADAIAGGGGGAMAADDDPELVRDAVPFALKSMEGLLEQDPHHEGLLLALASGFTQYGFAFVASDAEVADQKGDLAAARAGRERARKLFLRARDYGLRGLDEHQKGIAKRLRPGPDLAAALRALDDKKDVPLLYWTAAAWSLAISSAKGDMALVSELPAPVAMMERALALDEGWGEGAIHEYFLVLDPGRTAAEGGGVERAKQHYERALALSKNKKLGPRVSYAEGVLVKAQDREAFTRLLEEVLSADPSADKPHALENVLAQRRARALLGQADDLFL
ncbi:MAG: TRAP transporter TatT component family protein [Anaeromyxobacteraceae bacterium]